MGQHGLAVQPLLLLCKLHELLQRQHSWQPAVRSLQPSK
jgi:hypothetical protein